MRSLEFKITFFMALSPAEPDGARQRVDGASPEGVMNWVPTGQVKNKPLMFANFTLMGLILFFIPSLN